MTYPSQARSGASMMRMAARFPRRSQSLAAMLPWLLLTGVITLVVTAVECLLWTGYSRDFAGAWMESWLTAWPIAFPVAYLAGPLLLKPAARTSAPARKDPAGLGIADIADASARVSAAHGLRVQRPARHRGGRPLL